MIDMVAPGTDLAGPARARSRRRRRFWLVLAAAVLVVVASSITAVAMSFHYLHAPGLETNGGGWLAPDNEHVRSVSAGPYSASVIAPRPGHVQAFEITLTNFSSVTQTVLGLADDDSESAEPESFSISAVSTAVGDQSRARFTTHPVAIPPKDTYTLRVGQRTANLGWHCRSEFWQQVQLRVRVGAFTRTETVQFDNLILEIRGACPSS